MNCGHFDTIKCLLENSGKVIKTSSCKMHVAHLFFFSAQVSATARVSCSRVSTGSVVRAGCELVTEGLAVQIPNQIVLVSQASLGRIL